MPKDASLPADVSTASWVAKEKTIGAEAPVSLRESPGQNGNVARNLLDDGKPWDDSALGPLTVFQRRAMASDFEVAVNDEGNGSGRAAEAAYDALDIVDAEEDVLSVFRNTSLASRINALASEMDIPVSPAVFAQLLACRRIWEESEGAFDITASILWRLWGFARHEGRVPDPNAVRKALGKVGMEHIRLDEERLTVGFDTPGVEINFGGIGKGFALDDTVPIFERYGIDNYLIQGGMSSALARGGRMGDGMPAGRNCWTVGVVHPLHPERRLARLRLANAALATGGSGRQYFFHKGRRLSHIIDPRTGYPATGVLSATVISPSAAEADALSTAFFVMGPDKTERFCAKHPDCKVLLVLDQKPGATLDIAAFNLTPEECMISETP